MFIFHLVLRIRRKVCEINNKVQYLWSPILIRELTKAGKVLPEWLMCVLS